MLPSPDAVLVHARDHTIPSLIAALTRVRATEACAALARALRADLAQITARPELAAQLLYRRLAWHDVADAGPDAVLTETTRALRAWLADLVRESNARVWLRSLLPCAPTLDRAFVQEFIGDFESFGLELAFVGDGSLIAAASPSGAVAWSCVSGARLESVAMPEPHKWSIDVQRAIREDGLKTYVIERASKVPRLVIPTLDFGSWSVVRALPSLDGAIVAGWQDDYQGIIARYDGTARDSRERWSLALDGAVSAIALSADGSLLAVQTHGRVLLLDPSDGSELGAIEQGANALALSFDNELLATAHGHAIRLWDVRAIRFGAAKPTRVSPTAVGRVDAQFDDRSRRVLMGGALRDPHSGATIAALLLDPMDYLEGGPPERCSGIFGDRVVEPGFSLRAFSLEDGVPLATAKLGPFAHWHVVRVAADGRSLAWAHHHDLARWRVCSIDTGAVLRESTYSETPTTSFEFSPDASTLATTHEDGAVRLWDSCGNAPPRVVHVGGAPQALCWSIDGARIVVALAHEGLVQVDVARGEVVSRCAYEMLSPFDEAPNNPAESLKWRPTAASIDALHGWSGFLARAHGWSIERDVGGWRLVDDASGDHVFIASATRPVVDRTGRCVATREALYAIEHAERADAFY
ncbi:MAG: WD40 repeat domain-containing protein [Deltaproteobacteria bacterium]|nr:WD40 repeat domain-containing protein [Deltaproteobacteria bacterium]